MHVVRRVSAWHSELAKLLKACTQILLQLVTMLFDIIRPKPSIQVQKLRKPLVK